MGGYSLRWRRPNDPSSILHVSSLTAGDVRQLLNGKNPPPGINLTRAEIEDKGKADIFVKTAALIQILWLVVAGVARLIQGLALTTLELSTLAYIPCALLVFYLWWEKPYNVAVPTVVVLGPAGKKSSLKRPQAREGNENVKSSLDAREGTGTEGLIGKDTDDSVIEIPSGMAVPGRPYRCHPMTTTCVWAF